MKKNYKKIVKKNKWVIFIHAYYVVYFWITFDFDYFFVVYVEYFLITPDFVYFVFSQLYTKKHKYIKFIKKRDTRGNFNMFLML